MKIEYTIERGSNRGAVCTPHRYPDGSFAVSPTRFQKDQVSVWSLEEVAAKLHAGYHVRVSNRDLKTGPSLVGLGSLRISN